MATGTVKDFLTIGAQLQRDGKNRQALIIYNQLLDREIEDGNLYNLIALAYRDLSELEEAEKYAILLGYNYQSSVWYEKTYSVFNKEYEIIQRKKVSENRKKSSRILKKFKSLFE